MMGLLNGVFGVHEPALAVRSRRLELLARNIANADTPNFKARDLDVKALLARVETQRSAMPVTDARHFPIGELARSAAP